MRLVRATAGHVPAHARPAAAAISPRTHDRPAAENGRLRRWMPLLIIGAIYLAAIVVNEWRLQQHVQELRDRAPVQVVEPLPAQPPLLAGSG